jgi:hypothetical protein
MHRRPIFNFIWFDHSLRIFFQEKNKRPLVRSFVQAVRVLPCPSWAVYSSRPDCPTHDVFDAYIKLPPIFNRDGEYHFRKMRLAWIEVGGAAYTQPDYYAFANYSFHRDHLDRPLSREQLQKLVDMRSQVDLGKYVDSLIEANRSWWYDHDHPRVDGLRVKKRFRDFCKARGLDIASKKKS